MMSLLGPWVLVLSWVAPSGSQVGTSEGTGAGAQGDKPAPPAVVAPAETQPATRTPPANPKVAAPASPKTAPPTSPANPKAGSPVVVAPGTSKRAPSAVSAPLAPGSPPPSVAAPVPATPPQPAPPVNTAGQNVPAPTTPSPENLSPEQLRRGPSLFETGKVGKMGVGDQGVQIRQNRARAMPQELPVQQKAAEARAAAPAHTGVVNAAVLKREIRSRFALLKDCPVEVARSRRTSVGSINASSLTLRWTISPQGRVADTQVVATSPTDGHVMDCVKREMSQWSFSPPTGGAVRVERPFKFRSTAAPVQATDQD